MSNPRGYADARCPEEALNSLPLLGTFLEAWQVTWPDPDFAARCRRSSQASLHSPPKVTGKSPRLTRVHGFKQGEATEDRAMSQTTDVLFGSIGSLWRYPVKSMMGEELNAAEVTERGLRGDRAYALLDA